MAGFKEILGIIDGFLRLGYTGVRLKAGGTTSLQVKNEDDSAWADIEAANHALYDDVSGFKITLQPPSLAADVALVLPDTDGSPGEFLSTDGTGVLGWSSPSGAANAEQLDETVFDQTSGTLSMFTPPANSKLLRAKIIVSSTSGGGSPTLSLGISGNVTKYAATSRSNLKEVGSYEFDIDYQEDGTPDPIIATVVASSQTFAGIIQMFYADPS